jgi:NAD(P)-dependent dehydrogenase (short-subunit alcohol dehydrogenase family)
MGFSWEIGPARWESTVNINILGVVHGVRAFVPHMLRVGQEAWIGNLASIGSFGQMPGQTAYIMTKHAVQAFSEGLYLEMQIANAPINVSSIVPGTTRTSIFDARHAKDEPEGAEKYRAMMGELAANHGMEADDAACMYIEQMAARRFWVSSHTEMVKGAIASRIAFLEEQSDPSLSAEQRYLLGL